ncbi:Isoprenylcysteine carboxyl methyltransferase family-domain-containing protein, partial [Entophlyctis helioformis]
FLAFLAIFHVFEYLTTAMFKANVSLSSFLLNHSREYHLAMIGGAVEFLLEVWLVPSLKGHYFIIYTGVLVVFASQMLRTVAMVTAGHNFSHIIAEYKEDDHKLVTTGVYSIFRHPSYTGFFYWSLGMQVVLGNPVCFCAFVVVLIKFFTSRIEFEEETLVEFFGDDYREYRKRTYTFIPSI